MTSKKPIADEPIDDSIRFESAVEQLESIVSSIEAGDLGLEESMILHRRGQALLKICRQRLQAAEQEIKNVSLDDGSLADGESESGDSN
ncbi:MAG: exodeoxyribonuclease VII small subunit [Phycisphaerae bacterium]|nr:exodeoxyribonuclease VII small subunit [Phycisphaerae bacterium]|tara:strand:+ start:248 stop:514 length:267 start_codon:yes stop_codon:yes gene_type:complete